MSDRQSQITNSRPLFIAHRGGSVEAPENTLAAFRRALALGADGIELDVQVTRDGVPVVFHDATLARLTGRRGRLARLTSLNCAPSAFSGEPIPTLAEVLALTRRRVVVRSRSSAGCRSRRSCAPLPGPGWQPVSCSRHLIRRSSPRRAARPPHSAHADHPGGRTRAEALGPVLAPLDAAGVSLDHRAIRSPAVVSALHRAA